jgi:hypothetical protein
MSRGNGTRLRALRLVIQLARHPAVARLDSLRAEADGGEWESSISFGSYLPDFTVLRQRLRNLELRTRDRFRLPSAVYQRFRVLAARWHSQWNSRKFVSKCSPASAAMLLRIDRGVMMVGEIPQARSASEAQLTNA